MYRTIVRRRARKIFSLVSQGKYEEILATVAPDVLHVYGGRSAVGGTRHSAKAMKRWFERVYCLFPDLHHEVREVLVDGWPWNTIVAVSWVGRATSPTDGELHVSEGVHIVRFKWGRITEIQGYPDTEQLTAYCQRLAQQGLSDAAAPPIED